MSAQTIRDHLRKVCQYFTLNELGIILFLAILAVVTGVFAPNFFIPEGGVPTLMHQILKLPGPGAGIMIFGGTLCFSFVLGLLLVKKTGTAVTIALLVILMDIVIGKQPVVVVPMNLHSLDVILFIAIIIEGLALLSLEKPPLKYVMPVVLTGLGAITFLLFFTGQAKMAGGGIATVFPTGYVLCAILVLCFAVIIYRYPVRYLAACAVANMYYILHFWLFFGKSFASQFPGTLDISIVLLCVAAVGGVLFAEAAYGVDILLKTYLIPD